MLTQQDLYPCFSNSNKIKGFCQSYEKIRMEKFETAWDKFPSCCQHLSFGCESPVEKFVQSQH